MNTSQKNLQYRFKDFVFDAGTLALFYEQKSIKIEPQVAQLLAYFLQHRLQNEGEVLSREDLVSALWPNRVVSDDALRSSIKKLRDILKDDAKSPEFIKTLPLKGYQFIADVKLVTAKPKPHISAKSALLLVCVLATVLTLGLWQLGSFSTTSSKPTITQLTDIAGSELLPSYNPKHQRLIFSHRANKDDFLQLYVKEMKTGKVTRLTWDDANYGSPMWSPNGESFAYIRSTRDAMHHYISAFDTNSGMVNTKKLDHDILSTHYLLAWSNNEKDLYLTDKTSPTRPQGVWLFDIDSNSVEQISSPSVPGQGDYFVKESFDGTQLAILRSLSLNKHELIVLHLRTGEIVYANELPSKMHRLVWSEDDKTITLGSFDGKLLRVKLDERVFEDITPQADFVNNLFYQCGQDCYYMRQHNGNYLDIAEQPNPFAQKNTGSFGYFELSGANDFPLYANTSNKVYFFSQYSQTSKIEYIDSEGAPTSVFDFNKALEIQSLALNLKDTYFVGLADSRLFILDTNKQTLRYLSRQSDIVYPPHWLDENTFVYAKLEKNEAMLYRYSLLDDTSTFLMKGYVGLINIAANDRLLIDQSYTLWRETNNTLKKLGALPSSQPNRLTLVGNDIYYSGREENTTMLYKLSIVDGSQSKVELAKNRYKANFDLSADHEKLAVVESLLAQSDLIKIDL